MGARPRVLVLVAVRVCRAVKEWEGEGVRAEMQ